MRLPRLASLALGLLLCIPVALAQPKPDSLAIAEANRLGGLLFRYDQAAWHATDALMPLMQRDSALTSRRVTGYAAIAEPDGWRVGYGRLSADSSAFLLLYEARLDTAFKAVSSEAVEQREVRSGFYLDAFRAVGAAWARFVPPAQVTYNTAVLPAPGGMLYVYLMPAQPEHLVYFLGGDTRYTFDPVQRRIVEEKPLHKSILPMDLRQNPQAVTTNSIVLTEVPTETDVFFAMSRPPLDDRAISHFVVSKTHVFMLNQHGIRAVMTHEAWRSLPDGSAAGEQH